MRTRLGQRAGRRLMAVALLASGAACGGSSGSGAPPPSTTLSGDGSAEGPATVSIARPNSTGPRTTVPPSVFEFVDYVVSGGIAGVNDHLKVYPDGRAVYDDGSRVVNFTVSAATVTELRSALAAADLPALPPVNGSQTPDGFVYRVIYGGQAVRYYDGAMPPSLSQAVTILNREMSRGKQQR